MHYYLNIQEKITNIMKKFTSNDLKHQPNDSYNYIYLYTFTFYWSHIGLIFVEIKYKYLYKLNLK
jgi:hypothetical protein